MSSNNSNLLGLLILAVGICRMNGVSVQQKVRAYIDGGPRGSALQKLIEAHSPLEGLVCTGSANRLPPHMLPLLALDWAHPC